MTSTNPPIGDPVPRAFAAWYRAGNTDQPSSASCHVDNDDKEYVVLYSRTGTLAVYRITNAGQLKRLKRWPAELDA